MRGIVDGLLVVLICVRDAAALVYCLAGLCLALAMFAAAQGVQ